MSDFEWAVKNGDIHVVKTEVEKNISLVKGDMPTSKRSALCVAADFGQTEVIAYLIEKGADVNAADSYGLTPLLSAIYEGHDAAVELLLKKGASKNGTSPDGIPYIECAEKDSIKKLLK